MTGKQIGQLWSNKTQIIRTWGRRLALGALALILALGATASVPFPAQAMRAEIYTVKPGDSLWSIARAQQSNLAALKAANQLPDPETLMVGMNLIIPRPDSSFLYTVKPQDSLWSISQRFHVSVNSLVAANRLLSPAIWPGQRLTIPALEGWRRPSIETNGYLLPGSPQADAGIITRGAPNLTYISMFSYRATSDGGLIPVSDRSAVNSTWNQGSRPVLTVTNFDGNNFNPDLGHAIVASPQIQIQLADNILGALRSGNYYGLNLDFENLRPGDRQLFTDWVHYLSGRARAAGYPFSIAMAPKAGDRANEGWVGFFDYQAIGQAVDYVVLMTYEWGWIGGPPMAIAPINEVEAVLKYATSLIPPQKILMGVPLYGYDWELPDTKQNLARGLSAQAALALATGHHADILWDQTAQSPYFYYWAPNGRRHMVWFEDAKSVMLKYDLAKRYGLRGVSYWVLGNEFPQNWGVLNSAFGITH